MKQFIILFSSLVLSLTACAQDSAPVMASEADEMAQTLADSQTYRVTFSNNWNSADHIQVPGNAHFSPIVAVAHNGNYDLIPLGGIANENLEPVAEVGDPKKLNAEISQAQGSGLVSVTLNTSNMFLNSMTEQSFDIEISKSHPYISFVSMIAPSPDWIVGMNLKLYSESQGYYAGLIDHPLYAIDAGTEGGDSAGNFSINNAPTVPKQPMGILLGPGFQAPFAFVSIQKIN